MSYAFHKRSTPCGSSMGLCTEGQWSTEHNVILLQQADLYAQAK